jgi:hypothetical protein
MFFVSPLFATRCLNPIVYETGSNEIIGLGENSCKLSLLAFAKLKPPQSIPE